MRACLFAAAFFFLTGTLMTLLGIAGHQPILWLIGIGWSVASVLLAGLGFRLSVTARVLRYNAPASRFRLMRLRGEREVEVVETPASGCDLAIHAVHFSASRNPDWDGFAVVFHIREGTTHRHFTIGAFKSEPLASACVARLPGPLKSIYRGQGPKLNVALLVRVQSLSAFRASRARCPKCGYDLSSILDDASRCPECGCHGERHK